MLIGQLLVASGYVTDEHIRAALERQKTAGGLLGENLIALGALTDEQLKKVLAHHPIAPRTIEGTDVSPSLLLSLAIKALYVLGRETTSQVADALNLSTGIATTLLETARDRGLVEVLGSLSGNLASELRFSLTDKGKAWAADALDQSQYVGSAPVSLETYRRQIERQSIRSERINHAILLNQLSSLVIPAEMLEELGPAVNSGRSMLLHGPPGNGKTSIAVAIGKSFQGMVYVPHAFEVDGQIIKVFDPTLHEPIEVESDSVVSLRAGSHLRKEEFDRRWVPCRRPVMIAGGELNLSMLDLVFNPFAKFYEAPLQVKAMNGVFVIDDFGRQSVDPKQILNRWIIPLEKGVDYLALHTGKKFLLPFNELVIFSTNLSPKELLDEAFLRRIPYKIEVGHPSTEDFVRIFRMVSAEKQVEVTDDVLEYLYESFYSKHGVPFSGYHPRFIIDRVVDRCQFANQPPRLDQELVDYAVRNLQIFDAA